MTEVALFCIFAFQFFYAKNKFYSMKKISKSLHRILSIVVGIFISIVCFTGAMLIFENEITEWQNPQIYKVTPTPNGAIPVSDILTKVVATESQKAEVTQVVIYRNPKKSYKVVLNVGGDTKTLYVNQYTGKVLGKPTESKFFYTMYRLHRFLLQPRPKDDSIFWGKKIVGISTLIFALILITGIITWFPRKGQSWSNRLKISIKHGWRRFWYDLHVVGGVYVAILLLLMALTGLTWAFPWYRTVFYGIFASGDKQTQARPNDKGKDKTIYVDNETDSIDSQRYVSWQRAVENVEAMGKGYTQFTISKNEVRAKISNAGNSRASDTYKFNPTTGDITKTKPYADVSKYMKTRGWVYSIHTGYWGGFAMRVIYFIAAMLGAALPLTGYYLWIKRRFFNKKRKKE